MGEAVMSFTVVKPAIQFHTPKLELNPFTKSLRHCSSSALGNGRHRDPYYDSEQYRGDGGDGTGHWVYEKQEDIEEAARAELWREELIEEIEQKVGGLRELEEAKKEEQLVK
ncbi:Photosynthetic NDH subunit of subcomplex B 4, chloroplastic [Capsicum annuum]|nr:Photosynthetic NDH subunit of subcomplex B 4, chloroplastic [Capsicum annuum]